MNGKNEAGLKHPKATTTWGLNQQLDAGNGIKKTIFRLAHCGEINFADYHERFGHDEEDIHCNCGQRRSKSHPFSSSSARSSRVKLLSVIDRRLLTQKEVLRTAQEKKMVAEWVPITEQSRRMRDGEEA